MRERTECSKLTSILHKGGMCTDCYMRDRRNHDRKD
jgi:hypothetical protein